jgi:myo-inositol-1-phosphate synthase
MEGNIIASSVTTEAPHLNGSSQPHINGGSDSSDAYITSVFHEKYTLFNPDSSSFKNVSKDHTIVTQKKVPKLGVMLVGLGGNNGSTFVCGILANKKGLTWDSKQGPQSANFYGSFT